MEEKKKFKLPFSRKIWKRVLRTVLILVGLYILLLVGLSIYISSSQKRLLGFINNSLKQTLLGKLQINNADITIWQTFPKIGITLENVTISDSFYNKPFLHAGEITAKAGFLDLLGSKLTISSIKVKDALIHSFTDANGYSNNYVLRSHPDTVKAKEKNKKPVIFDKIQLENVTVILEDVPKNKRYQARINEGDVSMNLKGSKYKITFDEDIFLRGLGFKLVQGYWLENQRVQANWKLEFDTVGSVLTIYESKVKIQGQPFTIKGEFDLGAKSQFHLNVVSKAIGYSSALAVLKPRTREKLQKLNLSAPVDITAALSGSLSKQGDPSVKVDFTTTENNLTTPVLNLNECNFSGSYTNQVDMNIAPDDSNSVISVNALTSKWNDVDLKAKNIVVTNLTNPSIRFEFFSQCTLPQLDDALSSASLEFEDGNAKLYVAYNGPLIPDPSLLDRFNVKIQIQNGKIVYVPRNLTFSQCNGSLNISGNNLLMNDFKCNLNTNHFVLNITGQNLNRLSANQAGSASINCNLFTPALNLSDFKILFAKKSKRTKKKSKNDLENSSNALDNLLANANLNVNIKANQVTLDHFVANNVIANVDFKNDDWQINQASLQHADGSLNITAKVHQVSDELHQVNTQITLQHINVRKLFYAFDNFGQSGITYHNLNGSMNANANIIAGINSAGKLVPSAMNGKLFFSLKNAALINVGFLKNMQNYVFKNRDLSNVQFAELKDTFDINNGDIYIHRMPIQSSAITMYVEGLYSFADRTDISIQVPLSTLTNKPDDNFKQIDQGKADKPGASIYLRAKDKDGQVKIGLDAFNKLRKKKHIKN